MSEIKKHLNKIQKHKNNPKYAGVFKVAEAALKRQSLKVITGGRGR